MIHTGTIIDISKSKTYVFTKTCDTVLLKTKNEYLLGQQLTFSKRDIITPVHIPRLGNYGVLAAAVLVVLVASAVLYGIFGFGAKPAFDATCAAVISIDINPSIELSINKENEIIDIVYANSQGQAIFDELDLKTKGINDGIDQIIEFAKAKGYLGTSAILFISAAPSDAFSQTAEAQLKDILTSAENNKGADIVTVYIDDSKIIDEAEQNDISIGRLLLHKYAEDYGFSISLQEIKDSSISEIFSQLSLNGEMEPLLQEPVQAETTPPVTTPSTTPPVEITPPASPSPSPTPSPAATPVAPSPTVKPSPTPQSSFTPKLTATSSNGKLKFSWTPLSGTSVTYNGTTYKNFSYYKVVASQTDSTPIYPDNGYLYVGSSYATSSWSVDPSGSDYNQSPTLESGVKYYFAITYVFENGKFTSNTVSTAVPTYEDAPVETAPAFSAPQLSVSASDNALHFNWTSIPESSVTYNGKTYSDFNYYKIVASQTDSTPIYPDNGYLSYISDLGSSSWSVNPTSGDYNKSPTLEAGQTYYFAITYVFGNGKFVSNTVSATVPGYSEPVASTFSSPTLSVSSSGGNLSFSWSSLPDNTVIYNGKSYEGFNYYKVVASETNPHPIYPDDGYMTYLSGLGSSSWSTSPSDAGLESGKTYYFAITYVFDNGKFVSNTVQFTVP